MSPQAADASVLWCPRTRKVHPSHLRFCPDHRGEELVSRPDDWAEPAPDDLSSKVDDEDNRPRSVCWSCGLRSPNAGNPDCLGCHESLVPPALVVEFPDGMVVVPRRGESVEVGRAGALSHIFERYPNVSRRHATIAVDEQGDAWLTPNPAAPNGSFVNGEEVTRQTRIGPGDQIRFATDREPSPGPRSRRIRQPRSE